MGDLVKPIATFSEDGHSYTYNLNNKKTISVTTFIKMFHPPFDDTYWSTYKALKEIYGEDKFRQIRNGMGYDTYPLYTKPPQDFLDRLVLDVDNKKFFAEKDAILQSWSDSSTKGTAFHEEREQEIYDVGGDINPWTGNFSPVVKVDKNFDNQTITSNLYDLEDGIYPELLVWFELDNVVILGQIDICIIETVNGIRCVYLRDFKTNKNISQSSSDLFYRPFNHLSADKLTKYALQLTLYSFILKQWGFYPKEQELIHYKNYEVSTAKRYELPYYEAEIVKMIRMFNSQNQ